MLFNSYVFVFVFMPLALTGFVAAGRISREAQIVWLTAASICFYVSWNWDWRYVGLLAGSTLFNLLMGTQVPGRRSVLIFAVGVDLAALGFFKYWDFFADTIRASGALELPALHIVLPLGISFYTFTQIAFLVDSYRGEARERSPINYALFVSFFPHLIAGPLFHHKQMMPQFADPARKRAAG
jgi:alginate O-acetyltransferase complex protein AlgI